MNSPNIGQILPPWSLESIWDDPVPTLESYRGTPLLILIFDLDCPGCLGRALPYANRLIVEERGVNVLGIHSRIRPKEISLERVRNAKAQFHIRFPYYQDHASSTTFHRYGSRGTPQWLLLDAEGQLVYSLYGSDPNNGLLKLDLAIAELTGKGIPD